MFSSGVNGAFISSSFWEKADIFALCFVGFAADGKGVIL